VVIVHVLNDQAFAKYYRCASCADMSLFRGMFLSVHLSCPFSPPGADDVQPPEVVRLAVQQAFLPKFENEGQDERTAQAIQDGAGKRYMVVTIKHSGSLTTLSGDLIGAKNSVCNCFTSAALLVLRAHYQRVCKCAQSATLLYALWLCLCSSLPGAHPDAAMCCWASSHSATLQQRKGHTDLDCLCHWQHVTYCMSLVRRGQAVEAVLEGLLSELRSSGLSVSFEAVYRGLSEHGQLPAGDHLVTTSICRMLPDGQIQVRTRTDRRLVEIWTCARKRLLGCLLASTG
jgi:hypothetical protein